MRGKAKNLRNLLAEEKIEASAAWGKIKMVMNGNQEVVSVSIDPALLSDKAKTEEAVKEATNEAIKKTQRVMADKIRGQGDFKWPGV